MTTSRQVQVGDVIRSAAFVRGTTSIGSEIVLLGHPRTASLDLQVDRTDEARATALFLVERTGWYTPKIGRSRQKSWRVDARRLGSLERYDPNGELVVFHQQPDDPDQPFVVIWVDVVRRVAVEKLDGEIIAVDGIYVRRLGSGTGETR